MVTNSEKWLRLKNGHSIWTSHSTHKGVPVLMLHGGPGLSHKHLIGFQDFLQPAGYQLFFYDQLGCGKSDKPANQALWALERYTQEIEEVRIQLGLENFLLFGFSWGGTLALEYAIKYQHNLKGMVISNMAASALDFKNRMLDIRNTFPTKIQEQLQQFEQSNDTSNPSYQEIIKTWFYDQYFTRLKPWPQELIDDLAQIGHGPYATLWGYNEFEVTGTVQTWNRWADLEKIKIPTLVMAAHYDIFDPKTLATLAQKLPYGQFFESTTGSHFSFLEDSHNYFRALIKFFNEITQHNSMHNQSIVQKIGQQ